MNQKLILFPLFLTPLLGFVGLGFSDAAKGKVNCTILGEGRANNPIGCNVFGTDFESGADPDLPCCMIAERNDQLPDYLKPYVRLEPDGRISIFYAPNEKTGTLGDQVLIPLAAPNKKSFQFDLRAEYRDGSRCAVKPTDFPPVYNDSAVNAGKEPEERIPWRKLESPDDVTAIIPMTFSYSRYPANHSYALADQCTLCRDFIYAMPHILKYDEIERNGNQSLVTVHLNPRNNFTTTKYSYNVSSNRESHTPDNAGNICPIDLKEWNGFGYFLPFRLTFPEYIAYKRSRTQDPITDYEVNPDQIAGVYGKLRCPYKLTFSNQYRLLVPPK